MLQAAAVRQAGVVAELSRCPPEFSKKNLAAPLEARRCHPHFGYIHTVASRKQRRDRFAAVAKIFFAHPLKRDAANPISPISPENRMSPITSPPGADALWRPLRFFELTPEDVTPEWMDLMVKRLLRELDRQLHQIEKSGVTSDANERAANARTLASLERALERLTRLEAERAARRETKVARSDDEARAALERRLDQLLAAQPAPEDAR